MQEDFNTYKELFNNYINIVQNIPIISSGCKKELQELTRFADYLNNKYKINIYESGVSLEEVRKVLGV